ncbi:MAG: nickel pincer cofactor biosynthesis protein LarB [Planctomycetota bacterium]
MQPQKLQHLLDRVARGELTPKAAYERLRALPFLETQDAVLDRHRHVRTGFPEAVYGASKTPAQMLRICAKLVEHTRGAPVLATRVQPAAARALKRKFRGADWDALAGTVLIHPPKSVPKQPATRPVAGGAAIVCAGTSDLPVAREAWQTLRAVGVSAALVNDVGVAGLHRLLARLEDLDRAGVIVAVAGMDGALPSVLAGLVPCPVIACPTSVGYGAGKDGLAPLLTMLNSCAPGVTVVNIDNGFGAAVSALRCLRAQREPGVVDG